MADTALIVPIHLDVLVANRAVLARDGEFRWWQYNYQALEDFHSPEPEAFGRQAGVPAEGVYLHWTLPRALRSGEQDEAGNIVYPRVPNRWLVVRAHGTEPREWTAWVIESDCPLTDGVKQRFPDVDVAQMSMYLVDPAVVEAWRKSAEPLRNTTSLDPSATGPQVANLGVRFPLADGWSERAADTAFLTAVAPGNAVFSTYYPHNVGVFSMYDALEGVDAGTVSYQVVGWYSDPADDILASWTADTTSEDAYAALLERLQWTVAGDAAGKATRSVYQGLALEVVWDRDGEPPADDPLEAVRSTGRLNVAVGNTAIDAFTALMQRQLAAAGYPESVSKLLQAFQYDVLPELDRVNGDAFLERRVRQTWFGAEPGGYAWEIVVRGGEEGEPAELTAEEAAWLAQLNADQAALDEALRELFDLQWTFHATWWKLGLNPDGMFPESPGVTNAELERYLDPADPDGITARLLDQYATVQALAAKVPQTAPAPGMDPEEAKRAGIQAFADAKGLDASKELKPVAAPRFWTATDPVVVVSGVEPAPATDPDGSLVVRPAADVVSAITIDGGTADAATLGPTLPRLPHADALPAEASALATEFFLLDPTNAPAVAAAAGVSVERAAEVMRAHSPEAYDAPLPMLGLDAWTQPWRPEFLEWKVRYTHIPYEADGARNWVFDGTDYHYAPSAGTPATEDRVVGGISSLGPHVKYVFSARLRQFMALHPDADADALEEWIQAVENWPVLAQALTGFNESLALRDGRAFRRPGPDDTLSDGTHTYSVAELAGFPAGAASGAVAGDAYQGRVTATPYLPNGPELSFHAARHGQFHFEALALYDAFGRRLWVIESSDGSGLFDAKNFPLVRDDALLPDAVIHDEIAAVAQLPPRALQPARLDFRLLDGLDDDRIFGRDADVNPIAGWVLPNHLDRSVLVYGPDGAALGEFRLVTGADGTKRGEWQPPAHGDVATLDDVAKVAPHLARMLGAEAIARQPDFETFLRAIDATLWTIDPLGGRSDRNLSVLIGRPLALVRARLALRLYGPAIRDTGWSATFDPPAPAFLAHPFAVRLGDQATREDGLIGYFVGNDYETFNSVAAPETTEEQGYVRQIGPVGRRDGGNYIELRFDESDQAFVTMLVDPRAAVHATTGLLPVKRVEVPGAFVERALDRIEVTFHAGPVVTNVAPTPAQGGVVPAHPEAITLPTPIEQNGSWSWWERAAGAAPGGVAAYDLAAATPEATFEGGPRTLREGVLQLVIDLNESA
ncbi:MAG TPA: hypothetical protein VF212_13360 [Longimicrobiales bacterium]